METEQYQYHTGSYYNGRNSIGDEEKARQCIRYVQQGEEDYPAKLRHIPNAPKGLYIAGKLPDPFKPAVAIIGARTCSEYGKQMAKYFGEALGEVGVQVISGMARGIDVLSQTAAIQAGGNSFGILGCGVDVCYPKENAELYHMLQRHGGLLSEFPPGTAPLARQFPSRNRIIAGLADAVVVIEAKQKSGTLITVDMALEQGRDVYAIPGRLTDPLSEGCNRLIKQGAGLLLSPEELLEELSVETGQKLMKKSASKEKNNFLLDKEENMVYANLDLYARNLEEIVDKTNISLQEITHILLSLELKGLIKEVGKNYYIRCSGGTADGKKSCDCGITCQG